MNPVRGRNWLVSLLLLLPLFLVLHFREPGDFQGTFMALDTIFQITILSTSPSDGGALLTQMRNLADSLEKRWSSHLPDSDLSKLCIRARATRVKLDRETGEFLARTMKLSGLSHDLFNPCMGSLTTLWHIGDDQARDSIPDEQQIRQALQESRKEDFLLFSPLTGGTLEAGDYQLEIRGKGSFDLGGIAKGLIIDACGALISRAGKSGLVNVGGDIAMIGDRRGGLWRIGIRNPRKNEIMAVVRSAPGSIVTSGDYERFFEFQGVKYHHILDPRTGFPTRGLASVTVLADDTVTADAAATAGMVAGPDRAVEVCRAMGARAVVAITEKGERIVSPSLTPSASGDNAWLEWVVQE